MVRRKRRRKYTSPDGLDWRDPNMPVYVRAIDPRNNQIVVTKYHASEVHAYYKKKMKYYVNFPVNSPPDYRNDPSYWWSRSTGQNKKNNLK